MLHIQLTECQKHMFFEKGESLKQEDEHLGDGGNQKGITCHYVQSNCQFNERAECSILYPNIAGCYLSS